MRPTCHLIVVQVDILQVAEAGQIWQRTLKPIVPHVQVLGGLQAVQLRWHVALDAVVGQVHSCHVGQRSPDSGVQRQLPAQPKAGQITACERDSVKPEHSPDRCHTAGLVR